MVAAPAHPIMHCCAPCNELGSELALLCGGSRQATMLKGLRMRVEAVMLACDVVCTQRHTTVAPHYEFSATVLHGPPPVVHLRTEAANRSATQQSMVQVSLLAGQCMFHSQAFVTVTATRAFKLLWPPGLYHQHHRQTTTTDAAKRAPTHKLAAVAGLASRVLTVTARGAAGELSTPAGHPHLAPCSQQQHKG
jgi:hypothetical protein